MKFDLLIIPLRESLKCKLEAKRKLIQRLFSAESLNPTLNSRAFFSFQNQIFNFQMFASKTTTTTTTATSKIIRFDLSFIDSIYK
jgi:hypothetical protein